MGGSRARMVKPGASACVGRAHAEAGVRRMAQADKPAVPSLIKLLFDVRKGIGVGLGVGLLVAA